MLCRDFNMENSGKLKRCFEEAWPQYGFTVFCKAHRWPCAAGQNQPSRWRKTLHSTSRSPPSSTPRRRLRASTHSRYRRGRFWWRRKCRAKYRGPWWRWPAVSVTVTYAEVHDWVGVDSDDTQWSDATLCYAIQHGHLVEVDRLRYSSDSTLYNKMPVGFENSALKMSFSLSSLQPSSGSLESPEHARLRAERPYNSLTKKPRKDPEQESWRRSWGNRDENKDEFWAALQSNYNYLMDNNLIESCKEASGELSWDEGDVAAPSYTWSFNEFLTQFSELYSWLNSIQEAVYGKEESVIDRSLRASQMEEMQRKAYRRKLFNDQANRLLCRYPDMRDEVMWRMVHLNSKWETLEQAITPCKSNPNQLDMCTDVEHEVSCLRKWIREMEARLHPLDFRVGAGWSLQELEEKAQQHMVVQRDVESHGKIVCSVVKLCEKIARADPATLGKGHYDTAHAHRVARSLERRWHHLYLRSLEWQCHLEALSGKLRSCSPTGVQVSDSDEEPVSKVPRLGGNGSDRLTDDGSYFEDDFQELCVMDTSPPSAESLVPAPNNTEEEEAVGECYAEAVDSSVTMVGPSQDLKKPCHHQRKRSTANTPSSEMVFHKAGTRIGGGGTDGTDVNDNHCGGRVEGVICRRKTACVSPGTGSLLLCHSQEDISKFNTSNRKGPNCATFYIKHHDTDSDHDIGRRDMGAAEEERLAETKSVEDSSDDEWTYKQGSISPVRVNGISDGSGSASESTSVRRRGATKKNSVVMRLDFGSGPENSVNNNSESSDMLLNGKSESTNRSDNEPRKAKGSPVRNSLEAIHRLVSQAEEMVREEALPDKMPGTAKAPREFEPLVFSDVEKISGNSQAKYTRIRQWLDSKSVLQPADSCDASGEYTTGDSDEEKESQTSEELNGSVATCRQLELIVGGFASSAEAIPDPETTPVAERSLPLSPEHSTSKVVLRNKRRQVTGERPWSVSGISQLGNGTSHAGSEPLAHFSISESALHQIVTATPPTGKRGSGANLSSITIDEVVSHTAEGSGSRNGSLSRRKVRLRKRTLGRKSESGSDGMTGGHSGGSDTQHQTSLLKLTPKSPNSSSAEGSSAGSAFRLPRKSYHSSGTEGSPPGASQTLTKSRNNSSEEASPRRTISRSLFKSGSFSGTPMSGRKIPERHATSDPAMLVYSVTGDVTSGTETDNECGLLQQQMVPAFKLGPVAGAVTVGVKRSGDSDVERSSAIAGEEQLSSFSEQAWDNYQEKYMSEPYSEELADSEAARRLLEFGDDYRNYFDSQSDCASSLSANPISSPVWRRRPAVVPGDSSMLDSDSDLEDIRHVIRQSRSQLSFSEHVFSKQLAKASPELMLASDFAEIVATCQENIRCLRVILDNVEEEGGLLSSQECKEIRGLVQRWDMLQARAQDLQRVRALQREMAALRDQLLDLAARVSSVESEVQDWEQLEKKIQQVQVELSALHDRKTLLLQVNVAVHRFLTDSGHPAGVLKDDVADLYRVWDETFQSVSQQLGNLQVVSQAWQQFEIHLSELQGALRSDQNTLRMLDSALQGGTVSPDVATSVRDVAKVLSEKQDSDSDDILCQGPVVLGDTSTTTLASTTSRQSTEGSLSDSGISDSGSEQELSERERRLAALRRLARHLEAVLAPGSEALVNMAKRIEQAENELRGLQRTCRDLIVRTAVCVEARSALPPPVSGSNPGLHRELSVNRRRKKQQKQSEPGQRKIQGVCGAGDPDDEPEPGKSRHWLWRVMRAALPFQMAIVALFCVACLLEPHCCDAINNLNLSLTPQLRYVRGPPPV